MTTKELITDTERIVLEVLARLNAQGISDAQVAAIIQLPPKTAEEAGEERIREGNTATGTDDGQRAEKLLKEAQELQSQFWQKVSWLEQELGIEVDSTQDLQGMTVDDLINMDGE